ncbi:cytochrome ubiquinol oxidase subunit I [Chloroflexota bacterium]
MTALALARLQFTMTTVYHFFFVPLTLGLSILVAIMETAYVRTGDEKYLKMTKFWGKLFLVNFAVGVVTGLVQEFQFGMNWSEFSRFVGDIFGVPLAIEALLAFFLESTLLGIWIFGWNKLPKAVHAGLIWLVALGSSLSAFWILVANSWMQEPVGFALRNGRAELTDFGALVTNPHVWLQFPHVLFAGVTTAGFFTLGISAYHLAKKSSNREVWRQSFKWAAIYALIGSSLVGLTGHSQGQYVFRAQPMKMAAAEAMWETEEPASLSLFTLGTLDGRQEIFSIRLPAVVSLLTCNNLTCRVEGMDELQARYEEAYGPGDYLPPIPIAYWSFRGMLTAGGLMPLLALCALYLVLRKQEDRYSWFLKLLVWMIPLPYVANSSGWLLAEVGRQPWIVQGLMLTRDGVSIVVSAGMVLVSLLAFTLMYGALLAADIFLLSKFVRKGVEPEEDAPSLVAAPDGAGMEGAA